MFTDLRSGLFGIHNIELILFLTTIAVCAGMFSLYYREKWAMYKEAYDLEAWKHEQSLIKKEIGF